MAHWRTTLAGVGTIIGAVLAVLVPFLKTGVLPSSESLAVAGAAISAGIGLIKSSDAANVQAKV